MKVSISESAIDKGVEKRLVEMMKENPAKLCQYFVLVLGQCSIDANASIKYSMQFDYNGDRHSVEVNVKTKKVK